MNHCPATHWPELTLEEAVNPETRQEVKDFIRQQFAFHFGAEAAIEPPELIAARDARHQIVGALGLRTSAQGFFSQHYLQQPLTEVMKSFIGGDIRATEVVEVVHLAVASPAIINPLLEQLADYLSGSGYRYLVCTATDCLQRFFRRRGWSITTLAKADPAALGADAAAWGAYYAKAPAVIIGDIREAKELARTRLSIGASA